MTSLCPRCGNYVDPALRYCPGCGGNLATLRQTMPVMDRLSLLDGQRITSVPTPAARVAAPAAAKPAAAPASSPAPAPAPRPPAPPSRPAAPAARAASPPAPDLSADLSADLSGEIGVAAPGFGGMDFSALGDNSGSGGLDFSGLGAAAPAPGSGELDFSSLGAASPAGGDVFDLDAGLGGVDFGTLDGGLGGDLNFQVGGPSGGGFDAGSVPTLSFDPSTVSGGLHGSPSPGGGVDMFDLDAQLGVPSAPAASGPAVGGPDIDFSALGGSPAPGLGSGDIDFSNLSTLDTSQSGDSGGDALDLSLSNFGGGLGELDFSSLVQDASAGAGGGARGDAIDFSGLSSIDIAPPAAGVGSSASGERPSDDVVYDLDLDMGATNAGGLDLGFGFDDKDISEMGDDLLKASMISYKPSKD